MCPSITTIHQPIREIAEKSVELLISAAAGEKVPARVTLPVRLVVRKSTDV
jgi:DNA-binding LacI/PurR family transcriptional regulator